MGSVIVDTMAGATLATEPKKLHPFFTAPRSTQSHADTGASTTAATEATEPPITDDPQDHIGNGNDNSAIDDPQNNTPKRKRRKKADEVDEDCEDIKKPRRGRKKATAQGPSIMKHFSNVNGGTSDRSSAAQGEAIFKENGTGPNTPPDQGAAVDMQNEEGVKSEDAKSVQVPQDLLEDPNNLVNNQPPRKMLQLNRKAGTIGSPPKIQEPEPSQQAKKPEDATGNQKTPTPKGKGLGKGKRRSARIATITYGTDDASRIRIGTIIDDILVDLAPPSPERKTAMRMPRLSTKPRDPCPETNEESLKKDTHPFFTGKAKKASTLASNASVKTTTAEASTSKSAPASMRPRIFSSTPCSPKKSRVSAPTAPLPQFGVKSLGLKTPGARLPAWPYKDMVHVRGGGDDYIPPSVSETQPAARKSKGKTINVAPEEMILTDFAVKLQISEIVDAVRNIDTNTFLPPPPHLRLPQKHFESGVKLEKRVLSEVRNARHPALAPLRVSLVTSLSAFDRYQCESVSWAQKYAPKSTVEVLQYGKDAFLLQDWLQGLKVQSVDTGEGKSRPVKPPKKKRKKNRGDDFIVDSDEEADEMDEISADEEDWSPNMRGVKKTVIRAGDILAKDSKTPARLTNTVVISGPHGCGKTSSVYAIAKELDFEVFEVNPGSRRSGKEILEKIGDMTRNHLVQHHQVDASSSVIDEEEVAEDIKSGKQATMSAFFKPRAGPKRGRPKKQVEQEVSIPSKPEPKKLPSKTQKQSLILLDEVDILYEEDKQFWTTVISLIAQSKRPFIMTCNDEGLVPLQTLSLHGIFRFSAPPTELAVDRLLLIAASEGHVLRRNAVEALFEARQHDMRACLMDLNYWCQIAVGDQRGGLDWFYKRWPKDCDVDEDGHVVRVISQDTYTEGMGWLAHDVVAEGTGEEELLYETHDFWQIDLSNWHDSLDLTSWAAELAVEPTNRLSTLEGYEDFTDAMSLADLSSAMAFATSGEEPIDCTLPETTDKARGDYILGRELLDAPVASTFDPLATVLPITMKSLARKNLQASVIGPSSKGLNALDEASVVSQIRRHAKVSSEAAPLTRQDFSNAFDILAASDKTTGVATNHLDISVFDSTMRNIALDVAPYVRSIVTFEKDLQKQRQNLSSLMSQGGKKRMRNTRASNAALEGGSRSTTRRERWFNSNLNGVLVMRTAGEGWVDAATEGISGGETGSGGLGSTLGPRSVKGRARLVVTDEDDDEDSGSSSDMQVD